MTANANEFVDYYKLLGVDPEADSETVRRAYLEAIKAWHPDRNPDNVQEAEEKTKILNQAYHVLTDAKRRKAYDRMLRFTRGKKFNDYINDAAFRRKLDKAYPAVKAVFHNVRELYALFKDAVKGRYRLDPSSIAAIGGGLLYFILPMDMVPDFIPMVGYLDDLAILTTIMSSLKAEIDGYRAWKEDGRDHGHLHGGEPGNE